MGPTGPTQTAFPPRVDHRIRQDLEWIVYAAVHGRALYCEQRTDRPPAGFRSFLEADDRQAILLRASLKIDRGWEGTWTLLSHGERKRAQIAAALWNEPDILALDEPTNHIDRAARLQLVEALEEFRGIRLIVSHDRALLDSLCRQCLFVEPDHTHMRPGGYSAGRAQAEQEEATARQRLDSMKIQIRNLKKEVTRARAHAVRSSHKAGKRRLQPGDHDSRARIDLARLTGRDAAVARRAKQLEKRLDRECRRRDGISVTKRHTLGVWTEGEPSPRDILFQIPGGSLDLGECRQLSYPDLTMFSTDRVALTGPNGSGKTTLIRKIMGSLKIPPDRVLYLPQEIDAVSSSRAIEQVRRLSGSELGQVMSLVWGSRIVSFCG